MFREFDDATIASGANALVALTMTYREQPPKSENFRAIEATISCVPISQLSRALVRGVGNPQTKPMTVRGGLKSP